MTSITELLKKLAAETPDLLKDLVPSNDCQGVVMYRGKRYEGTFIRVYKHEEKWIGHLKAGAHTYIPYGYQEMSVSDIVFDPAQGLFVAALDDRVPCTGDKAYTRYHGQEWVGVLRMDNTRTGYVEPADEKVNWGYHTHTRGLQVGYDENICWDETRGMYYAPADAD